jgi:hypothetical protein
MFNEFKGLALLVILFFVRLLSMAQGLGNSPYSSVGIGDMMHYRGNVRNMGMGYAGSSLSSKDYMNVLNPAGLANFKYQYNDSLVKFDVGYTIQYKTFKTPSGQATSSGANINNLAFTFPITKTYTSGIMLSPLAIVQNKFNYQDSVRNDPNHNYANYNYLGSGGIYQLQWMNGFGVTKNLALGLTVAYNFGSITQESSSQLISDPYNPDYENEIGSQKKTHYSGTSFKPAFIYKKQLLKRVKYTYYSGDSTLRDSVVKIIRPILFKVGGSVELFPNVATKTRQSLFIRNPRNSLTLDSTFSSSTGKAYLPPTYRLGASFENPGLWLVAADFVFSDWSNYNKDGVKEVGLNASSYTFALGGEIMPRNFVKESNKIYRGHRVKTYRAGLSYTATPVNVIGKTLYDYSFSIGASIPIGVRSKGSSNTSYVPILPKVSIAVVIGQRSTYTANQLSETYFRLQLSMTLYDKWFNKRRIQ